ncbi:MAG: hypothetical protein HY741_11460 [Chloroflexi bacterium]|nr:hypothetical protein [Chloroflexota bacterium]
MFATRLEGTITQDRRLLVNLPHDATAGKVEVIVLYKKPRAVKKRRRSIQTAHPAFGMWAKRADMIDSATYAAELRRRLEQRADGGR